MNIYKVQNISNAESEALAVAVGLDRVKDNRMNWVSGFYDRHLKIWYEVEDLLSSERLFQTFGTI